MSFKRKPENNCCSYTSGNWENTSNWVGKAEKHTFYCWHSVIRRRGSHQLLSCPWGAMIVWTTQLLSLPPEGWAPNHLTLKANGLAFRSPTGLYQTKTQLLADVLAVVMAQRRGRWQKYSSSSLSLEGPGLDIFPSAAWGSSFLAVCIKVLTAVLTFGTLTRLGTASVMGATIRKVVTWTIIKVREAPRSLGQAH